MTNDHGETPERPPELDSLPRRAEPAPELEERVVRTLQAEGLLSSQPAGKTRRALTIAAGVAASVLLFLAGLITGSSRQPGTPAVRQPTYALLLRSAPQGDLLPAEQQLVAEYKQWALEVRKSGTNIRGEKLADFSLLLEPQQPGELSLEEPAEQPAGPVVGFFLIDTPDLDQAVQIARSCPHLKYGGTIELRRIDPV